MKTANSAMRNRNKDIDSLKAGGFLPLGGSSFSSVPPALEFYTFPVKGTICMSFVPHAELTSFPEILGSTPGHCESDWKLIEPRTCLEQH